MSLPRLPPQRPGYIGNVPIPEAEEHLRRLRSQPAPPPPPRPDAAIARLRSATDLAEIAEALEGGPYNHPDWAAAAAVVWATWQRLWQTGDVGPPSHDLVTVERHWPPRQQPYVLTFEELSRQPGWLVRDAQPYCQAVHPNEERRGLMDVWIAADGRTLRREVVFDAGDGGSRAAHDAKLNHRLCNGIIRRGPVLADGSYLGGCVLAVPVGAAPRTVEEKKRFLVPPKTTGLRDTIHLTYEGSTGESTKSHDLHTALRVLAQRRVAISVATRE